MNKTTVNTRRVIKTAIALFLLGCINVYAEPTTGSVRIISIRNYMYDPPGQGMAYIQVDQSSLCGTDTYSIDLSKGGSKASLAVALSAFQADKPVRIEISNQKGCTGWASSVQSIYVFRQ